MVANAVPPADENTRQTQYDEFYEDVFEELSNFGEVEELNVCENQGDHLVGNVYAKFHKEEEASEALGKLQGRFYGGTLLFLPNSPYCDTVRG
jgi:splicing factor U2AF 35 kDa subunit